MMSLPSLIFMSFVTIIYVKGHMSMHVVDLTHALNKDIINWPGSPDYNFTKLFRGRAEKGFW